MYQRTPLSVEVKKVLKRLMITLLGLLTVISGYFFVKMSYTAERGYQFREVQTQQKSLESENRILQQQLLEAQSLSAETLKETLSEMVEPASPVYVAPKGPLSKRR